MKKIALGSQNAAKIEATKLGVAVYWPAAEVVGYNVPSGVSDQPLGHEETLQGALNRAKNAFKAAGDCDLALGMEGGVVEIEGHPVMMSYLAVTDGTNTYAVPATGSPLPKSWGEALKNGAELRPHVIASGLEYDYKAGVSGILTQGKVTRDEMFAMAVKNILSPWVVPDVYT